MLVPRGELASSIRLLEGGKHGTSSYAFSTSLGSGMIKLLPDVPTAIVFLHLAALAVLLIHLAVTRLRRFVLLRQSRNLSDPSWFRLLHVLLGLPK